MCTLIVAHQVHPKYPLIIGANRDEFYDRPAEEPDLLQILPLAVVAPKDLRGGGTWMGAAQGGWFVGLTNQDAGDLIMGKESRGHVVRECLLLGDHRLATRFLVGLNPLDYNPFNLVFGRPGAMFLCRVHHDRPIDLEIIDEGVTVVANDCSGEARYRRRENRATKGAKLIVADDSEDAIVTKLEDVLKSHDGGVDPYQSLCVHDDARGFGTRSSSVVLVSKDRDVDYYHSEGHLCCSAGLSLRRHLVSLDFDELEPSLAGLTDEDIESID
jgi:uncharacterized protein with NRDE domain